MALNSGTKLGPYEISSALGAGGMGEVYRARDTRLGRDVAIKILPAHLADNPGFRERFEREARSISQLSHTHICTLHDIGHEGAISYLVLEFLEGETLEQRLARGPLGAAEVLKISIQVADALDKAHQSGIVHRDLKPANVMLTKSGAKLMDFGLARQTAENPVAAALTEMTAETKKLTTEGSIIGTFQYMAPEQLEGQEADARTDIFALGAVMYEMATGKPAFQGRTKASLIAAILSSEPPAIAAAQPMSPPALDRVVHTCLAKNPADRFQSAHDLKLQLEWIAEAGSQAGVPAPVATRRRHQKLALTVVLAVGWVLAITALAAAWLYASHWRAEQQITWTELNPPAANDWPVLPGHITASPDGHYLAFIANDGTQDALWVRDLSAGTQQKLAGTEGSMYPFWSPDSKRIGFFQNGKLQIIAAGGGPIQVVCEASDGRGGSWSSKGWIVFTPTITEAIYKVPEGGGTPVAVTKKPPAGGTARNPEFLPDGEHFLYNYRADASVSKPASILAGSLAGGEPKVVLDEGSNTHYYNGHLLYFKDGNLVTQTFDPGSLKVSGIPVAIAEHIEYWPPRDMANFTATDTGILFYRHQPTVRNKLVWIDTSGKELGDASDPIDSMAGMALSPDGNLLAVARVTPDNLSQDIWLLNLQRRTLSRVTLSGTGAASVAFSPDGKRAAFVHSFGGREEAVIRSLEGTGDQKIPMMDNENVAGWSADGSYLVLDVQNADTKYDVYFQPLTGDMKPYPVLKTPAAEQNPMLSPNSKWLAYDSDESGRTEVYVAAVPGPGAKWQVSNSGGSLPQWSHDGKSLYYVRGTKLVRVDILDIANMQLGASHDVADLDLAAPVPYQLAPDGKRILLSRSAASEVKTPVQVIAHWTQLLNK